MSNKFHNKFHRYNHHTSKGLAGTIADAGYDPIASHESQFLGDFVLSAGSGTLSSRDIASNTIIPFTGSWTYFPENVYITNLSAISATVNYQNILITELSGFVVSGTDISLTIPETITIAGDNNLALDNVGVTSNSWGTFDGDLQTKRDLYVSGVANIVDEYALNITTIELSAYNSNFTNEFAENLTSVNLTSENANITNINSNNIITNDITILNNLSTDNIYPYTTNATISTHGNIDMLGYSISGIGNNSLNFQSGLKINSDSQAKLLIDAYSVSENISCSATGQFSHTEGVNTQSNGLYSHAEGNDTISNGHGSHAEGGNTESNGLFSHVGGANLTDNGSVIQANGYASFAHGLNLTSTNSLCANGEGSIAIGVLSDSQGEYSNIIANGKGSFALGVGASALHDKSFIWSSLGGSTTNAEQFVVSARNGITFGSIVNIDNSLNVTNVSASQLDRINNIKLHSPLYSDQSQWGTIGMTDNSSGGLHIKANNPYAGTNYANIKLAPYVDEDIFNFFHGDVTIQSASSVNSYIVLENQREPGTGSAAVGIYGDGTVGLFAEEYIYTVGDLNIFNNNIYNVNNLSATNIVANSYTLNGSAISAWPTGGGDPAVNTLVHNNSANWDTAYNNMSTVDFTNSYIFSGGVVATGTYLTLSVNGSALAIPLYDYATGLGDMIIGKNFIIS